MGWLKSIFGKKVKEQKEIPIDGLLDWLDNETKPEYESFESRVSSYIEQVKSALKKIEELMPALENAEIKDADKIQSKVKSVVLGHRGNYIRMLKLLIHSIKIPADIDHSLVLDFVKKTENYLEDFTKNSTKSYYASQHLFHKEIEAIAKAIGELDSALKGIKKLAEKTNITQINKLKEKIKKIKEAINRKQELGLQLKEAEKKLHEFELSKQLSEKKIKDLGQSREFSNFNSLKQELNGIKNDILQLETDILQMFSPLERALKKFSRITLEDDKLIEAYASSPVAALMSDNGLKITELLQNMKKQIQSNSIELKDKQKEKTLDVISSIEKEHLANIVYKYSSLQEKKEAFERQIKANKVLHTKKELEYKLEHIESMLNKIKKNILEIGKNKEKIDINKLKIDLQNSLNNTLKQEIKII